MIWIKTQIGRAADGSVVCARLHRLNSLQSLGCAGQSILTARRTPRSRERASSARYICRWRTAKRRAASQDITSIDRAR